MSKRVRFKAALPNRVDILINIISHHNMKQQERGFEAFISLVNKNKEKLKLVKFVDTCYLQRHYDKRYATPKYYASWERINKPYLNLLEAPYDVLSWKDIMDSTEYDKFYQKISVAYLGNADNSVEPDVYFRECVDATLASIANTATMQQKLDYLLEESSVTPAIISLIEKSLRQKDPAEPIIVLTYAGKLNKAVQYGFNLLEDKATYIGYNIPNRTLKQRSVQLTRFVRTVGDIAETLVLEREREEFLARFPAYCCRIIAKSSSKVGRISTDLSAIMKEIEK